MSEQLQDLTLTKDEIDALTKDIQAVLIKHNADMGVQSTITLMRSPGVPTPYGTETGQEAKKEEDNQPNSEAEKSSKESGGESS